VRPRRFMLFFALTILICAAAVGFWLTTHQPEITAVDISAAFCKPSKIHIMGCDAYGNDLMTRILMGAWRSLTIALVTVTATAIIGVLSGTALVLAPRFLGLIGLRFIDCFLAFPGLLLAILMASLMRASSSTVMISLIVMGWASQARLVRALMLQTMPMPFVESSRAAGAGTWRILVKDIYPALWGQLKIQWVFSISAVIMGEAGLSFLGLGGPLGEPSWGALIAEGRSYLVEAPHLSLFPGIALFLTVLTFQFLAQSLKPSSN